MPDTRFWGIHRLLHKDDAKPRRSEGNRGGPAGRFTPIHPDSPRLAPIHPDSPVPTATCAGTRARFYCARTQNSALGRRIRSASSARMIPRYTVGDNGHPFTSQT